MLKPLHRSALVRQLAGGLPLLPEAPRQDLAERLGEWLSVADVIALHAALQAPPVPAAPRRATAPGSAAGLRAALQRLRGTLEQAIAAPPRQPVDASAPEFSPHQHRYLDQQRRMEMGIEALRGHVRQTLAATSPRLAQLASLDATLERLLGGREQKLLSGVPAFLKARFERLRQTCPDSWPEPFEQEMRQALLAELDLRLLPLTGMVEALERAGTPP